MGKHLVITGATGNIGRPLVQLLTERGHQVRAVSRHGEFPADLTEPESLKPALDGADALFLLYTGELLVTGADKVTALLEIARAAGVRRVVQLSSQGVGTRPAATSPAPEAAVRDSGLQWTILRGGGFASNAFAWAESVRTRRLVEAPFADVALPVVDPADIAACAAAALTGDEHTGRTYVLTGPRAVTPREQAAAIGAALGEAVRFTELTREQARERMLAFMPEPVVASTLEILGNPTPEEQQVSADVAWVLGHPAGSFAGWAAREIAAFR